MIKKLKKQIKKKFQKQYEFPDGKTVVTGKELFQCSEIIFQPSLIGKEDVDGIHTAIYISVMKCSPDIRQLLCNNIVLSGGTTMLTGFPERLQKRIKLIIHKFKFKI